MRLGQKGKRLVAFLLVCFVMFTEAFAGQYVIQAQAKGNRASAKTSGQSQGVSVAYHSKEDIRNYVKSNGAVLNAPLKYKTDPVTKVPYAPGSLSDETQRLALDMLRQIRYIAGISDQVRLSDDLCSKAQAGAFVNYVNDELSHSPVQPEGMDQALYQLGREGAGSSNIAWASQSGYSLNKTIVLSWMEDGDKSNIDRIGHRRWLLNPKMGKTGFGAVSGSNGTYSSVYAFDTSNSAGVETGVAWPAQNMPAEYFTVEFPWSISMGKEVDAGKIHVKLTRASDKKEWNFSKNSSDGYFNVNNGGYGQPGCIIFRPDLSDLKGYEDGDSYQVTITGYSEPISYTVNFFDLVTLDSISAVYSGGTVAAGGTVSKSKITVTGKYSDGTSKVIEDFTILPYKIAAGSNHITVQYKDKTAVVNVTGTSTAVTSKITVKFDAAGGDVYAKWQRLSGWKLNKKKATIKKSKTMKLSVSGLKSSQIIWKTSNKKVASVSGKGVVKAKKAGTAVITAITEDGSVMTCNVKVKKKAKKA